MGGEETAEEMDQLETPLLVRETQSLQGGGRKGFQEDVKVAQVQGIVAQGQEQQLELLGEGQTGE